MKLKNYILTFILSSIGLSSYAQYGTQKKADNLFNKYSFSNASAEYYKLIEKNYNVDYAKRQLADSYAFMRNPDSALVYYKDVVEQENVPIEYYYNYAQALRGAKNYDAYKTWMIKYKNAGGVINEKDLLKDGDFIDSIFNAKQEYFLANVNFNSKYSDFGPYEHNGAIYFASARDEGVLNKHTYGWNGEPFLDIYKANNRNDSLVNHQSKLKGNINSIYHDGPLTISKDGKTIYFSRNNFNKHVLGQSEEYITNLKIYKATLIEDKWANIEELPFNSNSYSTAHPALNNDGTKLYFASDMPGGKGGTDIYYVDIKSNGSYGEPKNVGSIINTNKNERFPFINSENTLFFASDGHPGLGLLDIFVAVSDKKENPINVLNLGVPVNSSKDDFSFFMSDDGLSGFFASNRNGGVGSDDIYAYDRIPQLKVEGVITDIDNSPIANATVELFDDKGNKIAYVDTDENGKYEINIDRDTDYKLNTNKDGFIDNTKTITSKGIENNIKSITSNFVLNPKEKPKTKESIQKTEFYPIYFDFNRHDIRRPDGTTELDRIVNLMVNVYPKMVIKIESHTDSRGPSTYNDKLSTDRANTSYKYLIDRGVAPERITEYKGFGEQNLVNDCNGAKKCTQEEHQLNRRTEFILVRME